MTQEKMHARGEKVHDIYILVNEKGKDESRDTSTRKMQKMDAM